MAALFQIRDSKKIGAQKIGAKGRVGPGLVALLSPD
jgi:hypothetical protein